MIYVVRLIQIEINSDLSHNSNGLTRCTVTALFITRVMTVHHDQISQNH